MAGQHSQVFFPEGYTELFDVWDHFPSAVLFAGATALIREQGKQILDLPSVILSLDKMDEMRRISRTERFLEIGAMVKLSQIIDLGKVVPVILRRCLENIAGQQLRNMATIGGNICFSGGGRLDSAAVLAALDAQFELRTGQFTRWISASRFYSVPVLTVLAPQELLSRIRIPLNNWDYSVYKKFAGQASQGKIAVFLVKTQKTTLTDIRIVYKNGQIRRDRDSETILIGKNLPLGRRIASDFVAYWDSFIAGSGDIDDLSRKELINFIELNINNLTK